MDIHTEEEREKSCTKSVEMQTNLLLSSTSPRKRKLYQRIKKYKKRIADLESKMQEVQDAKIGDINALDMLLDKYYPEKTAEFLKLQARLFQQKTRGRRYNSSFKQHCLAIYFANPKAYRNLAHKSKIFCLPSCNTLKKFTQHFYIDPGVQDNIFQILKLKVDSLAEINKYCIICIDEMSLKKHLFYNITRDKVIGFEDIGQSHSVELPAQNAAVVMVRGICQSWKQPLSYFFSHSTLKASDLLPIIKKTVRKLKTIDLKVVGLTSDMGSNFYKLSQLLNISTTQSYFTVDADKIFYIFDTPHLEKATRNNWLNNYYIDGEKTGSWEYIEEFYNIDKKAQYRTAPKLTDIHINPNNFQRMKVKYATQIFSKSVSAGMTTLISLGSLSTAATFTAEFIERFNTLFDILNSSKLYSSDSNKQAFTNSREQATFLNETKDFLQRLKVIRKSDRKDITNTIKSIKCWIITINSVMQLFEYLQQQSSNSITFLLTRRLNQDCLENFFGVIRSQNGNACNPTPIQFYYAFKKHFSVEYSKIDTGNCAADEDTILTKCQDVVSNRDVILPPITQKQVNFNLDNYDYRNMPVTEENVFIYICGYLLRRIFTKHFCDTCAVLAEKNSNLNTCNIYTYFKAYNNEKGTFGNLYIPSVIFVNYIKELHIKFFANFSIITKENVMQQMLEILCLIPFLHVCPEFPKMYLLKLFIRVRVYYVLKFLNRDFKNQKGGTKKINILRHI